MKHKNDEALKEFQIAKKKKNSSINALKVFKFIFYDMNSKLEVNCYEVPMMNIFYHRQR